MPAKSPKAICDLFHQYMAEGDLDAVLSVYDPEAVILNQSREVTKDRLGLRQELAPLVAMKARFDYRTRPQVSLLQFADLRAMPAHVRNRGPSTLWMLRMEVSWPVGLLEHHQGCSGSRRVAYSRVHSM